MIGDLHRNSWPPRSRWNHRIAIAVHLLAVMSFTSASVGADTFENEVKPFLKQFCFECHAGDDVNGDIDFGAIETRQAVNEAFEIWQSMIDVLRSGSMPPEDAKQPSDEDRRRIENWYQVFVGQAEPRPAVMRPRRLSVTEYRNTLRTLLGFDLEVDVIEAEQTVTQRSMVIKLLPEDPPGQSGFKNDTHQNPLTSVVWDQYSFLVDAALQEFFSLPRREELARFTGPINGDTFTPKHANRLLQKFVPLVKRRDVPESEVKAIVARLGGRRGAELKLALKAELEMLLMSPDFIYRGLRIERNSVGQQPVDRFELAERLSYFLWADMPDEALMQSAADGTLSDPQTYASQIDRMLASPKADSLAEVFVTEWLSLSEIEHVSDNPPETAALQSQPIDFVKYLIAEDRPLIELIDSRTAFANRYTAKMYGADSKQLTKSEKQRGIEQQTYPNQRIELEQATYRGGILTMPGVLAMNRGPILRGTWVLERILGDELPDPPANVGQVEPNRRGENLTFRQRFEQHRRNNSCAVCHNKIDPLGFALQAFDDNGHYRLTSDNPQKKRAPKKSDYIDDPAELDTSGKLPSGETFAGIEQLKQILATSQREAVVRNIVQRTMAYAYGRKLTVDDAAVVRSITQKMIETNGSWRDLFHEVAGSLPFRETILLDDRS
tara:strand:- start:273257 stop:275254 length:1998 start_codon:yes stop_codon:yes gene_type:complete